MNTLESLKERLKRKPIVQHNPSVKVVIDGKVPEKQSTVIVVEKDDGNRALQILEKIKQKQMSNVTTKYPQPQQEVQSKAPVVEEFVPKKKAKKISKKPLVLLEEVPEVQKEVLELPEGGPRLEELDAKQEQVLGQPVLEEQEQVFVEEELLPVVKPKKRITKRVVKGVIPLGPETMISIGDTPLSKRLPPPPPVDVKVSSYYMNNREIFVNFINGLFEPYREDLLDESKDITCDDIGKDTGEVSLLTHQKIVRDYMNLYTPYRGLLLFHGLGSGKTNSSIAIAEGMKSARKVIVMTPASLRRNYIEEIKKFGDLIYRKNQFWEWIPSDGKPKIAEALSAALGLPLEYVRRNRGAWLVNITKPSNYATLTTSDKKVLNDQLDEMIRNKYTFINYNGLRREKFKQLTNNFENNIFDNAVVIIDEAHNLISRIVNKINKMPSFAKNPRGPGATTPISLSLLLYEFLLRADNCRVVLLTGTPVINYSNEFGILFNILRGYIKTWNFTLTNDTGKKISKEVLEEIFAKERVLDYLDYVPSSKTLTVTRNPYGFENKITASSGYKGVTNDKKEKRNAQGDVERDQSGKIVYEERGTLSDEEFVKRIVKLLQRNDINAIVKGTTFTVHTALPDTLDEFINVFINKDTGSIINVDKLKRRIIGLTSYFRSAQEELLPVYDKNFDKHEVLIPMSDYQFKIYEDYRQQERQTEKPSKKAAPVIDKDEIFKEPSSTYRIFSRLACNFVMPTPPGRPNPADYRTGNVSRASKKLLTWFKKLYSERKIRFTKDKQQAFDTFIAKIPANNLIVQEALLQTILREFMNESITNGYVGTIEDLANQMGHGIVFEAVEVVEEPKEESTNKKERKRRVKKGGAGSDDEQEQEQVVKENPIELFVEEVEVEEDDAPVILEGYKDEDANARDIDELEGDEILEKMGSIEYREAIKSSLRYLQIHSQQFLTLEGLKTYSPKFLTMLENIEDPDHQGLHLVYSQFRSMEGIGIFSLTLEANGFSRFKIKRTGLDGWEINMSEEDMGKPCYALYTGTEDAEEREIIRNIYNGMWDYIPNNIATQLRAKSSNNNLGEIIKVLMITSAGSEGINLRNTRYVHIMEPYWHPVRSEQVIGRARRICSHQGLPKALQTVEVFIYIMTFTQAQLDSEFAVELRLKDVSKREPYVPQTSDQKLYEISTIKEQLTAQLLTSVKESAIDCATHIKSTTKEGLTCLSFGQPTVKDFSYNPNYSQDENDTVADINRVIVNEEYEIFTHKSTGKKYALQPATQLVFDYESVMQSKKILGVRPILLGKLVKNDRGKLEIVKVRI
jgi:hypothetical protein